MTQTEALPVELDLQLLQMKAKQLRQINFYLWLALIPVVVASYFIGGYPGSMEFEYIWPIVGVAIITYELKYAAQSKADAAYRVQQVAVEIITVENAALFARGRALQLAGMLILLPLWLGALCWISLFQGEQRIAATIVFALPYLALPLMYIGLGCRRKAELAAGERANPSKSKRQHIVADAIRTTSFVFGMIAWSMVTFSMATISTTIFGNGYLIIYGAFPGAIAVVLFFIAVAARITARVTAMRERRLAATPAAN